MMYSVKHNVYDFRGLSGLTRNFEPSFANIIKPKNTFTSKILSSSSLKSINSVIDGAQKFLRVYNEATPIIKQVKPMIDNVRTTFKVAKAFKKFSKESTLEKAFDNLPDYEENVEEIKKEEKIINKSIKIDNSVPAPFYPD